MHGHASSLGPPRSTRLGIARTMPCGDVGQKIVLQSLDLDGCLYLGLRIIQIIKDSTKIVLVLVNQNSLGLDQEIVPSINHPRPSNQKR